MATPKTKTAEAKAQDATKESTISEVKEPTSAATEESTKPEASETKAQAQGDTKTVKDPEPAPPTEESNGDTQVKLKMSLWDSQKQKSFTVGDLYPCSEKEAQRLIEDGTAVRADD